jgi:hypothetical protein
MPTTVSTECFLRLLMIISAPESFIKGSFIIKIFAIKKPLKVCTDRGFYK